MFYFGNAVGESGNHSTNTFVDGLDFAGARDNPHNFVDPAVVMDGYDYNRDSFVDGADLAVVRDNSTNFLTALKLITVPSVAPPLSAPSGLAGEGEAVGARLRSPTAPANLPLLIQQSGERIVGWAVPTTTADAWWAQPTLHLVPKTTQPMRAAVVSPPARAPLVLTPPASAEAPAPADSWRWGDDAALGLGGRGVAGVRPGFAGIGAGRHRPSGRPLECPIAAARRLAAKSHYQSVQFTTEPE